MTIELRLKKVLVEALNVDEEDIKPDSLIVADLQAQSIDFLDIVFRVEHEFGIKIERGELFPDPVPIHEIREHEIRYEKVVEYETRIGELVKSPIERERLVQVVDGVPQSQVKDIRVDQLAKFIQGKIDLISK